MMAINLWSDEDTATARLLMAKGANDAEFMRRINRTKAAARCRIKWLDDPSERDRSTDRARKSRGKATLGKAAKSGAYPARRPTAPEHVISDARRRADAPRTLTAWFCGDPAPGQSALDRRELLA